jgi:hypothetical protein
VALTNLPYDDEAILDATMAATILGREVRDVEVHFTSSDITDGSVARVTATISWTVPATDAADILERARPGR